MRRRQLLIWAGAMMALPRVAHSQRSAKPTVIGYLSPRSQDVEEELLGGLRKGLAEAGYVEGRNLSVAYRWAKGQYHTLEALADELVRLDVSLIVTSGGPHPARAARAAAPKLPIVFLSGSDPVGDGLVASLNKPGGQLTGISVFTTSLGPKRLELLREVLPKGGLVGFLVNTSSQIAEVQITEVQQAARAVGQELLILSASTEAEIDRAFTSMAQRKVSGLLMGADTFYQVRRKQLVDLAARHRIPTMYEWREFVAAGGLMSYSTVRSVAYREAGIYAGRILKGANPAEMPVIRSTTFELVINLKTARMLGLSIPRDFLSRADAVLE